MVALGVRPLLRRGTPPTAAAAAPPQRPPRLACRGGYRLAVGDGECQLGARGPRRGAVRCGAQGGVKGEAAVAAGQGRRRRETPGEGAGEEGEEGEEEGEVDFSQGGWLWTNNETAKKQAIAKAQQIRPKKSLGQNFLKDEDVLARVVRAAGIQEGDLVLEVGPGTGNLTRFLLAAGARVTSVEKDHRLVESLQSEFGHLPNFRLIEGDILRLDATDVAHGIRTATPAAEGKIKVVANLPYYITTDVLKKYLPLGDTFSNLTFMLQEEVAQRFAIHKPGSRDYRYMSVYCRYFSTPEYKFRISRHLYFPKPKVDGAVVNFELLPPESRVRVHSQDSFLSLVHGAFLHRRKMMKNSMALPSEEVAGALVAAGLNPDARAQDLSLDDFVAVHQILQQPPHRG